MQMQRGAFSGIIRDALQLSAIGRIERVQDKPCERIQFEFTMASKCPKCEKTVYFGKFEFMFTSLVYSVPLFKTHSPLFWYDELHPRCIIKESDNLFTQVLIKPIYTAEGL